MGEVKLNLARKWRSKNFDEIIGQDLLVRMLKNGLYLQQYFPVYLFSGQRGCGKTSTARVFGTALNCERLEMFQGQPQKNPIPCLTCLSCKAMEQGKHPDFIEIDAASHTGVDNVRMLIDSASLMPLMGKKKIYLIDEAHMLSKAAFNALLKILEEPPASVVFILATTDPQKIIETVRSRCFQLFFKPVAINTLQDRLRMVCEQEGIPYDDAGLATIVKRTEGSVRDALNLLEQIRFSNKSVTHEAVLRVLGYIDDFALITLFRHVLHGESRELLQEIARMEWKKFSAQIIWDQMLELMRTALWLRHDITPKTFSDYHDDLKEVISGCSIKQLTVLLQMMYDQELLFGKTTSKHDFFEMVLLDMCQRMKKGGSGGGAPSAAIQIPMVSDDVGELDNEGDENEDEEDDEEEELDDEQVSIHVSNNKGSLHGEQTDVERSEVWKHMINEIMQLDEPLMNSIFVQGVFKSFDKKTGIVEIEFSREASFFQAWIEDMKALWEPCFKKFFGETSSLKPLFIGEPLPKKKRDVASSDVTQKPVPVSRQVPTSFSAVNKARSTKQEVPTRGQGFTRHPKEIYKPFAQEFLIDISDKDMWHKTHMIMSYLPGTIKEIRG